MTVYLSISGEVCPIEPDLSSGAGDPPVSTPVQAFGRSGPITVLTSPFAAVSAAAAAEAAAAAAAGLSDKQMDCSVVDAPAGQESSSDASHQTNGLAAGCGPQSARNS